MPLCRKILSIRGISEGSFSRSFHGWRDQGTELVEVQVGCTVAGLPAAPQFCQESLSSDLKV